MKILYADVPIKNHGAYVKSAGYPTTRAKCDSIHDNRNPTAIRVNEPSHDRIRLAAIQAKGSNIYICTSKGRLQSGPVTDGAPVTFWTSNKFAMTVRQPSQINLGSKYVGIRSTS